MRKRALLAVVQAFKFKLVINAPTPGCSAHSRFTVANGSGSSAIEAVMGQIKTAFWKR